jgi:hypothetical protein
MKKEIKSILRKGTRMSSQERREIDWVHFYQCEEWQGWAYNAWTKTGVAYSGCIPVDTAADARNVLETVYPHAVVTQVLKAPRMENAGEEEL